ncbi:hypothetical protein EV424DRAFT_1537358 [Suillus variegatus]|nr:hypothetical protein EV424DRAFT_1537358 [Suillus variegatus]
MEHRPFDSSPPIPDPSSAPFPSFSMPMPEVYVQRPSAEVPYGQPYASEYSYASEAPYTSEPPYASEHLASEQPYTPDYPYPFQQSQQPYDVPPHVSVPFDRADLPLEPWVPEVPEQSDGEEVDPMTEPIRIPTPEHVQTGASVSRRPSRLQRLASFLGLKPKESSASHHS